MSEESEKNRLGSFGIKSTKIYLIALFAVLPALAFLGALEIKPVELNQIGDFLAGAFGPLAIFWLVLGFFQQGQELQNSVEALKLQTQELRDSVEQQKVLVAVTEKQLELDKTARDREADIMLEHRMPHFNMSFGRRAFGAGGGSMEVRMKNTGATAQTVSFLLNAPEMEDSSLEPNRIFSFDAGEEKILTMKHFVGTINDLRGELQIICKNSRAEIKTQLYQFQGDEIVQVETKLPK